MLEREAAGFVVEGSLNASTWASFTLNGFQCHHFDEEALIISTLEHGLQCFNVICRHKEEIVHITECCEILLVTVHAGMGYLSRSTSTSMECTFDCKEFGRLTFVPTTRVCHVFGVHVCDS